MFQAIYLIPMATRNLQLLDKLRLVSAQKVLFIVSRHGSFVYKMTRAAISNAGTREDEHDRGLLRSQYA